MTMQRLRTAPFLAFAAAAALGLGLAGCGGSSNTVDTTPPTPPPPPPADLTALFAAAQDANDDAIAAGKAAAAAVKSATDSTKMLTTTQTGGESKTVMTSAQAILDARTAASSAVTDAEAALAAANKAKTDATGIAADHPQKAALTAAIDAAIKAATAQVDEAKKARDSTALKLAVARVEGTDKKGTPRSLATGVGNNIAAALAIGADRSPTRVTHHSAASTPDDNVDKALKFETDDHQGMTWKMIVGESNVMMKRLGGESGNTNVQVASITGMTAKDVDKAESAALVTGGTFIDGVSYGSASTPAVAGTEYKGIPGKVWCLGGTDGCKVTDGKLGTGWYFQPSDQTAYYVNKMDDPDTADTDESLQYKAETLYASYGHWLSDGTGANVGNGPSTPSRNTTSVIVATPTSDRVTKRTSSRTRRPIRARLRACRSARWAVATRRRSIPAGSPPMSRCRQSSERPRPSAAPSTTSWVTRLVRAGA